MIEKGCLRRKESQGGYGKGKEAGCEEVGRVRRARGQYDQKDRRFISNTISLRQVPARPCQYKGTSKKGLDKE